MTPKIVLASTSPFRKTLMESLEIPFEAEAPLFDEEPFKKSFKGETKELCAHLAKNKAVSLKENYKDALIIGSDQSLFCGSRVLGKGHNFKGALEQLNYCSGKPASLITSVYIHDTSGGGDIFFEDDTTLFFKDLDEEELTNYLKADEPYKCAGSFKFESRGHLLFEKIHCEDPSAIQGLPLMSLVMALGDKGVRPGFL